MRQDTHCAVPRQLEAWPRSSEWEHQKGHRRSLGSCAKVYMSFQQKDSAWITHLMYSSKTFSRRGEKGQAQERQRSCNKAHFGIHGVGKNVSAANRQLSEYLETETGRYFAHDVTAERPYFSCNFLRAASKSYGSIEAPGRPSILGLLRMTWVRNGSGNPP